MRARSVLVLYIILSTTGQAGVIIKIHIIYLRGKSFDNSDESESVRTLSPEINRDPHKPADYLTYFLPFVAL